MISDLKRMIDQVSREKGLEQEVLIKALEEAVKTAARKKFGADRDLEVSFNPELGEVEVFEFKEVVEKVTDDRLQVSLVEARKLDPECEIGDSLGMKMETSTFGRIAAQSAKQVIMQRLKEAERDIVYDDFKDRKGEIINGIVQRFDKGSIIVNLGRTEAELPPREQIPRESYRQGDRIRAYILDVKQYSRGPQIILSRTHPNFLSALFENEVPEISEGIVKIMQVAREPGSRSKIAVYSKDPDVDPVGACVGMKGSRVQAVVQELRGEKIDIVTWDPDPAKFICNALAPAEIIRVIVDEENHSMEVVVPDDQLSLAIGKRGQNVRLASRLTGWGLDVISETNYNKALKEGYQSLLDLEGVGEKLASELYQEGFRSAQDLSQADVEELLSIEGMTEDKARVLIEDAAAYVERKQLEAEQVKETEASTKEGLEEKSQDTAQEQSAVDGEG
ncbi:MAG: transcription termination/antitermination protein NusA [Deltaproteobacteria bacterium]|nr:transcription termination/antitermination protein NusA [Deltaproteobacteria bacterium]MBW1929466.1 transcription termination/antitermination protein NusA [Deltaproteobacteria bacterium]MBW2023875.1 transcription termination/antitermination protein NusA [Deltaproteobacteria bacterium]MBW2124164.1 transcription termination/antitermination protein NusA [Deltaproteobacteria bacterium]RLB24729.1 MAG: transcription termination/antitermination protein NusA [Deltaproteobacteria bacterium]